MCRLLFMPPDPPYSREELERIVQFLESRQGGDGNGFFFRKGRYLAKNVGQPVESLLRRGNWRGGFLFHTRKATTGPKTKVNCHPFRAWQAVACHNGVWHDHKIVEPYHSDLTSETDSEVLFRHLYLGYPAFNYGTVLLYEEEEDRAWCYVSGGSLVELQPDPTKERIAKYGKERVESFFFYASEQVPGSIETKDLANQVACIWPHNPKLVEAKVYRYKKYKDWWKHKHV